MTTHVTAMLKGSYHMMHVQAWRFKGVHMRQTRFSEIVMMLCLWQ